MLLERKGIRSRLRNRLWGVSGDGSESGDAGARTGERFLFCMTAATVRGSKLIGEADGVWAELVRLCQSGNLATDRENLDEWVAFAVGRTDNRSRSSR